MHGQSMSARRNSKGSRRRYTYTQNDRTRWLAIGTLLVASAAALGYICGKYSEKRKSRKEKLSKLINFNNNNINNDVSIKYERNYRVLIYGDSTTWGFDPDKFIRLSSDQRYPNILQKLLNDNTINNKPNEFGVEIISEGLNGRTIIHRDLEGNKKNERRQLSMNGLEQLLPILYSHKPIDIVIIMLGINDCKSKFNPSANKIAKNMDKLIKQCISAEIWPIEETSIAHGPQIILISPAFVTKLTPANKEWGFNQSSMNVSQSLHTQYKKLINKYDKNMVYFINANEYIQTGSDSVHIDGPNNHKLAMTLTPIIKTIINDLQKKSRRLSVPSFTASSMKHHKSNNKLIDINANNNDNNNNHNQQIADQINEEEEEEYEDDSLSELEQERNGDVIIKNIENNENFDANKNQKQQQCNIEHIANNIDLDKLKST